MSHVVIADAGLPLIALARVGHLDLLCELYDAVRVPPTVHAELAIDSGKPGAKVLADAFAAQWLTVKPVVDAQAVASISRLLDPGESEAIVLAEQESARFLLIDDARGRREDRKNKRPVRRPAAP